jgi:curved DNA-binding protein CbpA
MRLNNQISRTCLAVNHYDRLKVSRDAPPEVIRAAYRALATKLHPDRQGAATGPDDVQHEQMAALNAAYEVLIDPKLRQDYDATLDVRQVRVPPDVGGAPDDSAPPEANTRVDMDWLVPKPVTQQSLWPPSRQMMVLGGGVLVALVLGAAGVTWQMAGQHQMERALSDQYAKSAEHPGRADELADSVPPGKEAPLASENARVKPPAADMDRAVAQQAEPAATSTRRRPTVEELSRMSDEELLRVLPTLDADAPPAAAAPTPSAKSRPGTRDGARNMASNHMLDGKPLNLRTDTTLVDPLAPESSSGNARKRP